MPKFAAVFNHGKYIVEIPFGHITDGILYRDAAGDFSELKLVEVSEEEAQQSVSLYIASFEKLKGKFLTVEEKINSSNNKGSFLSSLLNIKEQLSTHEGLGDYVGLLEKIQSYENLLVDYVTKNRQKNTDIKQALLLELEVILANNDLEEAFEQIKELKARWIKTGSPSEDLKAELEGKFTEGVDRFFEKRNSFFEDKKELVEARISEYQEIIKQIKEILKGKGLVKAQDKVKSLQGQWKEVGRIPEAEFQKLNDSYWELCQQFFDKKRAVQKEVSKNKAQTKKESLAQRQKVIEKIEALKEQALTTEVGKQQKELANEWKNSGQVSRKDNPEIHQSYLALSREIQERGFVYQLAKRKNKGFDTKAEKEKYQALQKVVRDLLRRDESELQLFQENLDKMHINKGSFVDMLDAKLKAQQEKVAMKQGILKGIQAKIKES
ncbi:hypothetical protein BFP72_03095 [Reichenbachiella sp. 5M10]|uniref:DUF349 domain-containing protein n=1 Tax=Reichenbachiella sp. 5M10 TaxID=1889772 RepID=UPI000C14E879|nr:DUF349 domain-containing protein [Reichenbachiella sp. 5M10]PIB34471.1 hypothetical protein BFP72_03095 [Reichenbachiella sp. 5M10]